MARRKQARSTLPGEISARGGRGAGAGEGCSPAFPRDPAQRARRAGACTLRAKHAGEVGGSPATLGDSCTPKGLRAPRVPPSSRATRPSARFQPTAGALPERHRTRGKPRSPPQEPAGPCANYCPCPRTPTGRSFARQGKEGLLSPSQTKPGHPSNHRRQNQIRGPPKANENQIPPMSVYRQQPVRRRTEGQVDG